MDFSKRKDFLEANAILYRILLTHQDLYSSNLQLRIHLVKSEEEEVLVQTLHQINKSHLSNKIYKIYKIIKKWDHLDNDRRFNYFHTALIYNIFSYIKIIQIHILILPSQSNQ